MTSAKGDHLLRYRRSLRSVADLARAGSDPSAMGTSQVRFEVHHIQDRPRYFESILAARNDDFIETLTSAANGIGVIVGTSSVPTSPPHFSGGSPRVEVSVESEKVTIFQGAAVPNPTFLYETAESLEGLISVEVEPTVVGWNHGEAILKIILEIARVAAQEAEAPILSLQCPAQLPAHHYLGDGRALARRNEWSRSSSLAVRFAFAIGEAGVAQRLELMRRLDTYCEGSGFGLWMADTRPNHREGNWFQITKHDKHRARKTIREFHNRQAQWILPLTLVGPARVGSTWATLELLDHYTDVALLACTVSALDDLAFIHLQLGVPANSGAESDAAARRVEKVSSSAGMMGVDGLERALTAAGLVPDIGPEHDRRKAAFSVRASDYAILAGPVLPISPDHGVTMRPLWISWEANQHHAGLQGPIVELFGAFDDWLSEVCAEKGIQLSSAVARLPNIEYLIARDTGRGSVRAKGKIAVPEELLDLAFPTARASERGAAISTGLEEMWHARLESAHCQPTELTVAWRENWLGRWSSLNQ